MSERLERAITALEAARDLVDNTHAPNGLLPTSALEEFSRLVAAAGAHARIAQAEALERIAHQLEVHWAPPGPRPDPRLPFDSDTEAFPRTSRPGR